VGEPTFGKGTVQTLVNLSRYLRTSEELGRLRLTMAQFFRVLGGSTQHRGVTPDIIFPTAQDSGDYGERSLDHALPWAAIKAVIHRQPVENDVAYLRQRSESRITRDPGFRFLMDQERELDKVKDKHTVSLNEDRRRAERQQREQRLLDMRNRLRAFRGLPALASLDEDEDEQLAEQDKDPEGVDRIMLDETAHIMADWIVSKQPLTAQAR
jgi:carboxyl-terminal processing protease